jgi:hypothetical protein
MIINAGSKAQYFSKTLKEFFAWVEEENVGIREEFDVQIKLYAEHRLHLYDNDDQARHFANLMPYLKPMESQRTGLTLLHGPYWRLRRKNDFSPEVLAKAKNDGVPGKHIEASGEAAMYLQRDFKKYTTRVNRLWEIRLAAEFDKQRMQPLRRHLAQIRAVHNDIAKLEMPNLPADWINF